MNYRYYTIDDMSHVHTVYIDKHFLWYRNYSNKVLLFESVHDIILNIKNRLPTLFIYH
jgi:hypothetical protein